MAKVADQVKTTITMSDAAWQVLRELSFLRQRRVGGRPSMSATVGELIQAEQVRVAEKADAK